jgi:predicted RNase H-like nuclease (RuvC/YqgF family)
LFVADTLSKLHEVSLVEIAILFAALGYVTQLILDATGKSRSSRILRSENEDLVRRNKELDDTVQRLKAEVGRLEDEVGSMRTQVTDLAQRDQTAVLREIGHLEATLGERWKIASETLREVLVAVKAG